MLFPTPADAPLSGDRLIAQHVQQLQQTWPEQIALALDDRNPSVYDHFPYLFQQAFPTIQPEVFLSLAVAGRLIANLVLINDSLFDKHQNQAQLTNAVLRLQAIQYEIYALLYDLFPVGSRFWRHWHIDQRVYMQACSNESLFATGQRSWGDYTEQVALQIIEGKNCLLRSCVAALVELSGDERLLNPLCRSINHYNIARQLFDDLCDWKEDLRRGVPSLLLARLLGHHAPPWQFEQQERSLAELGYRLYAEGHAQAVLEQALLSLDQSNLLMQGLPEMGWHHLVDNLRQRCRALLQDITMLTQS